MHLGLLRCVGWENGILGKCDQAQVDTVLIVPLQLETGRETVESDGWIHFYVCSAERYTV